VQLNPGGVGSKLVCPLPNPKSETNEKKRKACLVGQNMSEYIVAGGTFTDLKGEERFDLLCPSPGEPPYIIVEDAIGYFKLIWQNVHLYRVENDYSLSLIVLSHSALQWGVQAPERVKPNEEIVGKLRAVIKFSSVVGNS
jgi:hypothetical protein